VAVCGRALVVGAAAALALLAPAAPARAAGGVWGAGGYSYVDGIVCIETGQTSPLASWDFGTGAPAFLTAPVRSDGQQDSAALPFAAIGRQTTTPVAPGRAGFTSAGDIATYSALLTRFGNSGTAQTARIAAAVMTKAGVADPPACAPGGIDALLAQAARLAGPYTLTIAPQVTPAELGQPDPIRVTVHSASGQPVPDLTVSVAGPDKAGAHSAVSDAFGQVLLPIAVPADTTAAQVTLVASVSAPIGLTEVTVAATPTATNPTGVAVPAIYPAAPVTVTNTAVLPVDTTATPAVRATASSRAVALGAAFEPRATVSGLRGHTAALAFTVYGPIAPATDGHCDPRRFSSSSPVAATTNTVPVTGNQTSTATAWTPTQTGCYLVHAGVRTSNATPPVSADSGYADPDSLVQVSAATAQLGLAHGVAGRGAQSATLTAAHTDGVAGTVTARLLGPVPPPRSGSCAGLDYGSADAVTIPSVDVTGDRSARLTSTAVDAVGCYQWQASLALTFPGVGTLVRPAPPSTVLVLAPTVTETSDQVSVVSPYPITTHVNVTGTYQQPSHVRIQMLHVPSPPTGCQDAEWTHATAVSIGPPVAVPGDTSALAVPSGPTPALGCYRPVPTLVVDANPAITVTGTVGHPYDVLLAGVALDLGPPVDTRPPNASAGSWLPVFICGGGFAALVVVVIGFSVYLAHRDRSTPSSSATADRR